MAGPTAERVDRTFVVRGSSLPAVLDRIAIVLRGPERTLTRPAVDTIQVAQVLKRLSGRRTIACTVRGVMEPQRLVVTVQGELEVGLAELLVVAALGQPADRAGSVGGAHVPGPPAVPPGPVVGPSSLAPSHPAPSHPAPRAAAPPAAAPASPGGPAVRPMPGAPITGVPAAIQTAPGGAGAPSLADPGAAWYLQPSPPVPPPSHPAPPPSHPAPPPSPPVPPPSPPGTTLLASDGQRVEVGSLVLVGRDPVPRAGEVPSQLVRLADPGVSKTHLGVRRNGAVVEAMDRGSTNGSQLLRADGHGEAMEPGRWYVLAAGQSVVLGDVHLRLI